MKLTSRKQFLLPIATAALSMGAGASPYQAIEPNSSIDILGISFHPQSKLVTLRWTSQPDSTYLIEETTDLSKGWIRNLAGIEGTSSETSYTILPIQDQGRSRAMFFRVLEMPQESLEPNDIDLADESTSDLETASVKSPTSSTGKTDQEVSLKAIAPSSGQAGTTKFQFQHQSAILLHESLFVG